MPGLIPASNPGSLDNQKESKIGSQMGHTKKIEFQFIYQWFPTEVP